ncbi:NADH-ubiquinone oxidoreductase 9.5 kDa subunit [Gigaspora margarita]|uniref:NADH-ubiquinone oxidoreductase 9.5 kDa subunit n=1 Tax=Gigaspora margarita TaxID=4874 RepID=A0A8H4ADB9_GIGMA|nr:NADH-ubiquinone oxidoreductase 9.5 kDa subunit [Gigaspora margarita]
MTIPFVTGPLNFLRRMATENTVYFWSLSVGILGPVLVVTVPPIRERYFGYVRSEDPPITYPMPKRPRNPPAGYEDP